MKIKGPFAALAASAVIATTSAAYGKSCAPRDDVITKLEGHYGESFSGGGLQNSSRIFEVWIAEDYSTWTILMTQANGMTCIMAAGSDWRDGGPKVAKPAGIPG